MQTTTTKITMLDVFRAMHSMNVDDVRDVFVRDYQQTVAEKDAKIAWLEKQLSAVYANNNNDNNNTDNSATDNQKLADELAKRAETDARVEALEKEKNHAFEVNTRLFKEGREAISKQTARIEKLKSMLVANKTKMNADITKLKDANAKLETRNAQLTAEIKKLSLKLSEKASDEARALKEQIENQRQFINSLEAKITDLEIKKFTETNVM